MFHWNVHVLQYYWLTPLTDIVVRIMDPFPSLRLSTFDPWLKEHRRERITNPMIMDISIKTDVIAKTIHRIGTTPRPLFPIEIPFGLPLKSNFEEIFKNIIQYRPIKISQIFKNDLTLRLPMAIIGSSSSANCQVVAFIWIWPFQRKPPHNKSSTFPL